MSVTDDQPADSSKSSASSDPKHRSFALIPSAPRPWREQIPRGALIIGGIVFAASSFALCFCPQFYVTVGLYGIAAMWLGSRGQRIAGVIMLAVAVVVGILGYQQERGNMERVHRAIELHQQQQPK